MAHLLLLEDDPNLSAALEEVLTLEGHRVQRTARGSYAVVRSAATPFDVVLLDVLNSDLSGIGATAAIRELSGVPIVVMSASSGTGASARSPRAPRCACRSRSASTICSRSSTSSSK